MPGFKDLPGIAALMGRLVIGHLTTPRQTLSVEQRIQSLPLNNAPIAAPIHIHWNDQLVPYIDAASEADLAVGLGIVHAHLRLAQIEFLRYVSQGRVAELVGPIAGDIDHSLRVLNLGKTTPEALAALPEETLRWMESFVAGLNHVVRHIRNDRRQWPEELQILGVAPSEWTVADILTLSRLNSADFTWSVWPRLLPLRSRKDWLSLWRHLMKHGGGPPLPSETGALPAGDETLDWLGSLFGKPGGSNAVAVSSARSEGGTAKLSGDPHLPMILPGFWLLAGLHCPTMNAVGYMLPGLPAVMVGRSPDIAWGGTSLHAASSDLFDVTDLPDAQRQRRSETIHQRWGKSLTVEVTDTEWGPILTEAPAFGGGKKSTETKQFAVRWVGHQVSDEITALLAAARATSFEAFQTALKGFAVAAQNMVYADTRGNIGQLMAARLPSRPAQRPDDMILPMSELVPWQHMVDTTGLPTIYNPPEGFVASANNRPAGGSDVLVSCFFSPDDRVERLRKRLTGESAVNHTLLSELQRDIHSDTAITVRDKLLPLMADTQSELYQSLSGWNGDYDTDSRGALVFEHLLYQFALALHGEDDLAILTANWDPRSLILAGLAAIPEAKLKQAMTNAIGKAEKLLNKYQRWGDVHRLRAHHPLAVLPLLGRRWRFGEMPIAGANETLMKSAHGLASDKHYVGMSSTARYLFDLGDADSNWFVMLGGQDGHPGSGAFFDQLPLWQQNTPLQFPLRLESVKERFAHCSEIIPTN